MTALNGDAGNAPAPAIEDGGVGIVNETGIPLADPHLERRLLGTLLVDHEAFAAVADHVFEEDFFDPLHRRLFATLRDGYDAGYAVGMKSLTDALGGDPHAIANDGLTVSQYIARLMVGREAGADIQAIAVEIHECADRRANEMADDMADFDDRPVPFVSKMGLKMWVDQNDPGPEYEYPVGQHP